VVCSYAVPAIWFSLLFFKPLDPAPTVRNPLNDYILYTDYPVNQWGAVANPDKLALLTLAKAREAETSFGSVHKERESDVV
jgi:hypothetical protein